MEWSMGRGVPSAADYRVWGSVVSSPSGVRVGAPAENGFWHILKATERSFLYLYDKNLRGGQFALASPYSKFWGGGLPVIYAHEYTTVYTCIY